MSKLECVFCWGQNVTVRGSHAICHDCFSQGPTQRWYELQRDCLLLSRVGHTIQRLVLQKNLDGLRTLGNELADTGALRNGDEETV